MASFPRSTLAFAKRTHAPTRYLRPFFTAGRARQYAECGLTVLTEYTMSSGENGPPFRRFEMLPFFERLIGRSPLAFVEKILLNCQKVRIEKNAGMKRVPKSKNASNGGHKTDVRPAFHLIDTFIPMTGSQHW